MITKRIPISRRVAWVGVATALALAAPFASAQEDNKQPQHQVSEKVSEALQKLKPLQDAKNFTGMMQLIDGLLPSVGATSYDRAYLLDMKARLFISEEQYGKAIPPWEEALKLSDQYKFFDPKNSQDITKFLAQLIFSEASSNKNKEQQQEQINKAAQYLKRYLDKATKPEPETQMLYAQILYYRATADGNHIDQAALKEARSIVEKGLQSATHPKEGFYMLLLAIVQQQNDYVHSAELMELLLKQFPNKKDVWPMLFGTYVNLAGSAKQDSPEQRQFYVRAINTIERAQKLGFMNAPRDNFNLVTLYLNSGQFGIATGMLHEGMQKGKIESTLNNWKILGAYYQQDSKNLEAVNALKEAAKLFPKEGSLELQIGQIYQQDDNTKEAHDAYGRAIQKGNLGDKPHLAYMYFAYTALELGNYDEALKAINEALKMPDGAKDPQVKAVKEGIDATIAEREVNRERAAAAAKKF